MKTRLSVVLCCTLRSFLMLSVFSQPCWSQMYHESIVWTPQNPKFQFSNETFDEGRAYYSLSVQQYDKLILVCPNPTSYLRGVQEGLAPSSLYENLWYVDKESFETCKVGSLKDKAVNSRLFECNKPMQLNSFELIFRPFSPSDPLSFSPGTKHYFIATSDGSKESLNNTSGGHCSYRENGISMKMLIYVCYNESDPVCSTVTTVAPTTTKVIFTNGANETTGKPGPATQAARKSFLSDTWQLLAIVLAVCLACSVVIHSICVFVVCRRKTDKKTFNDSIKLNPQREDDDLENVEGPYCIAVVE